jgi:hypothetical protein
MVAPNATTTRFPVPRDDETLEQYTIRCASVAGELDPDDFNNGVWATWRHYRGPTEEERLAERYFAPDKYQHVPGVCVFAEHKTTTASGEKRNYKLRDLARIVRGNNDRISDVGAFPALSDGHTSNPDDANPRDPKILGYAGNYRLGRIGRKNPRWAIFQDEYHRKDAADVLQQKPRRSVELWTFNDGRAHFDPIAAIGAEAPRLPLPQRFTQFAYQGANVERYTCSGGGYGMAGMAFVPRGPQQKKGAVKTEYASGGVPGPKPPLPGEIHLGMVSKDAAHPLNTFPRINREVRTSKGLLGSIGTVDDKTMTAPQHEQMGLYHKSSAARATAMGNATAANLHKAMSAYHDSQRNAKAGTAPMGNFIDPFPKDQYASGPVGNRRHRHLRTPDQVTAQLTGAKSAQYSTGPVGTAAQPVSEGEEPMPRLAPEDLQEIVAAIAETPQFKWITEKMEEESRTGAPGTEDDLGVDETGEEPVADQDVDNLESMIGPDDEGQEPAPDMGGADETGMEAGPPPPAEDTDEGEEGLPSEDEDELEPEEKASMPYAQQTARQPGVTVERYTALQKSHDNLLKDAAKMHARIEQLERINTDNARRTRLASLAQEYPGFVDVDEEAKVALYSLGAKMNDAAFDEHVATVEKYAKRAAKNSVYIPEGDAPQQETAAPEKYALAQKVSKRAIQIATEKRNKGEQITYDEARRLAESEMSK